MNWQTNPVKLASSTPANRTKSVVVASKSDRPFAVAKRAGTFGWYISLGSGMMSNQVLMERPRTKAVRKDRWMTEPFDAYYTWLGIPPAEQPPHFYRLLGVQPFE